MKDDEKKEEQDIHTQTENIIKKIQEQLRLTEEALSLTRPKFEEVNLPDGSKSMVLPQKKKAPQYLLKIKDYSLEYLNLDKKYSKKPEDAPFDDCCSICNEKIYYFKYICIVCKDIILCPKCEIEHEHPVLKCKFNQLSSLESIYIFINTKLQEVKNHKNNSNFLSNIFSNKYELKLKCDSTIFAMRPKTKKNIPITILNLSNTELDCEKNKVMLYGKNNYDLQVYTHSIKKKLNKNESTEALILLESTDKDKEYTFYIEVFSLMSNKLKSNVLSFKVEINEDQEDEKLDNFFVDYPVITIESKSLKKGVKKIYEDSKNKNKFDPPTILKHLKNNKGNVDDTFYELFKY